MSSFPISPAVADYDNQVRGVTLTPAQPESCVRISINDDAIFEPNELFDVVLATSRGSSNSATVRQGLERARVIIFEESVSGNGKAIPYSG